LRAGKSAGVIRVLSLAEALIKSSH
jgi:hypothetical protein